MQWNSQRSGRVPSESRIIILDANLNAFPRNMPLELRLHSLGAFADFRLFNHSGHQIVSILCVMRFPDFAPQWQFFGWLKHKYSQCISTILRLSLSARNTFLFLSLLCGDGLWPLTNLGRAYQKPRSSHPARHRLPERVVRDRILWKEEPPDCLLKLWLMKFLPNSPEGTYVRGPNLIDHLNPCLARPGKPLANPPSR